MLESMEAKERGADGGGSRLRSSGQVRSERGKPVEYPGWISYFLASLVSTSTTTPACAPGSHGGEAALKAHRAASRGAARRDAARRGEGGRQQPASSAIMSPSAPTHPGHCCVQTRLGVRAEHESGHCGSEVGEHVVERGTRMLTRRDAPRMTRVIFTMIRQSRKAIRATPIAILLRSILGVGWLRRPVERLRLIGIWHAALLSLALWLP